MKGTEGEHGLMGVGGVRGSSMGPVLKLRVPGKRMVPDAEMDGK